MTCTMYLGFLIVCIIFFAIGTIFSIMGWIYLWKFFREITPFIPKSGFMTLYYLINALILLAIGGRINKVVSESYEEYKKEQGWE